jgi:hypothetical protein
MHDSNQSRARPNHNIPKISGRMTLETYENLIFDIAQERDVSPFKGLNILKGGPRLGFHKMRPCTIILVELQNANSRSDPFFGRLVKYI